MHLDFFLLCIIVVILSTFVDSYDAFTHILQGYFNALGQSYCPSASEVTLKNMGTTDPYQTPTKHEPCYNSWDVLYTLGHGHFMNQNPITKIEIPTCPLPYLFSSPVIPF